MSKVIHCGNKRIYTDEERAARKIEHQKAYRLRNAEKTKEYREANKERDAKSKRDWYERNADRASEQCKERYAEKREEILRYQAGYYLNNTDLIKGRVARWKKENPDRVSLTNANRRAAKKSAGGKLSQGIQPRLMALQKGKCAVCRCSLSKSGVHIDHVLPLSLGGSNTDDNIQLLCPSCNTSKNAKHPVDFMQQRGFLL